MFNRTSADNSVIFTKVKQDVQENEGKKQSIKHFLRLSKLFQRGPQCSPVKLSLSAARSLILRCPGVKIPKYTRGPTPVNKAVATKAWSEKRKTIPSPPPTRVGSENSSAPSVADKMDDARGDGQCSAGVQRRRNALCLCWSKARNGSSCSKTNDAAAGVNSHGWLAASQQEFTGHFFITRRASGFLLHFYRLVCAKKQTNLKINIYHLPSLLIFKVLFKDLFSQ